LRRAVRAYFASAAKKPVLRTLLVSDLEGFTAMLCALGDLAARDVMALHDKLLRDCLREHHGVERAHTGDGVIASFADAERAVSCAAAIQHRLRRYNERAAKMAAINVRVSVHSGRTLIHDNRLFGATVNTAVRLCTVADPGEVVISEAVKSLVAARSFPLTLRDLGELHLKGLPIPVAAFAFEWRSFGGLAVRPAINQIPRGILARA
jgi:class 3 adenylate cyclase